jgi:hypothetical protein
MNAASSPVGLSGALSAPSGDLARSVASGPGQCGRRVEGVEVRVDVRGAVRISSFCDSIVFTQRAWAAFGTGVEAGEFGSL